MDRTNRANEAYATYGSNGNNAILEITNLKKLYKNGRGVRSMTFSLSRGDVFGLLGSNGSGKTTAIKSIFGLCKYEGDIRLHGESVADNPRAALRDAACIAESPAFYGGLTAEQNLKLAVRYYNMPKEEAAGAITQALETVGLAKYRRERADRFSLGMKARLGLALCFISKPSFMALDEPLNGLDIEGMVEIRNIIINQATLSGAAFLISSHLAAEVEKTCNCVGIMDEGVLLNTERMDDVLRVHGSVEAYYLNTLRRVTPPGDRETPPEDLKTPLGDRETPPGAHEIPPVDQNMPPVDQNTPPGEELL